MTAQKHTPGEWTAKWSKYDEGVLIVQADMPTNRVLARFDGDGDGPDEQSLADAHLIAASPTMLEALKECLPLFDMVTALDDHGSNALGQAENLIRAAIAKATGQ